MDQASLLHLDGAPILVDGYPARFTVIGPWNLALAR